MILSGNPLDFLIAFLAGIALSFTPCVYPLIPISIGSISISSQGSKLKGFILSLVYASGVAVIYSLLGLLASLTGKIFGVIYFHPATHLIVGAIIIVFGLSMLDFVKLPWPHSVKIAPLGKGYFSTFFLGLNSGLMISPCVTPVLGTILFYLTTKKNIWYGTLLLLSFAYGATLILILCGTFSAILVNLPRLGKWMLCIKRFCAFLIIAMGAYFIYQAVGGL